MIRAEKISFQIGTFHLQDLNIEIAKGRYFVLLGPPGSGKTIFLECLCGLKQLESGRIYIDGVDVTGLQPRRRDIGYVPQDYALFPHLSVEENVAFGLRAHGRSQAMVGEMADMLGIRHLMTRRIGGLSGGEKQRVALARALVLKPKILLLDEPVCALDEVSRQEVCAQLLEIQRQIGLTTIHVSHNLEEAFSVADRAAILYGGVLQQIGSLNDLLRKPNSEFVARFMRCENIFSATVAGQGRRSSDTRVNVAGAELQIRGQHSGKLLCMIRPEDVLARPDSYPAEAQNTLRTRLARSRDCGGYVRVDLDGPIHLVAHITHAAFAKLEHEHQSEVVAGLGPDSIYVLPK
jgi:ABC-type Fe3+/spermidine/putrescine transport system ATPase subunit